MSNKPFILNISFGNEEDLIGFFNETFRQHETPVGLYQADSQDKERSQSVQQYVVRNANSVRMTDPLSTRGGFDYEYAAD